MAPRFVTVQANDRLPDAVSDATLPFIDVCWTQFAGGASGDGVTDDTAAIQAAINSLPLNTADTGILGPKDFANGGTVFLPRGRYMVTDTIVLQRGVRIVGEGREATQIVSRTADSVFHYPDAGRYIQDEIVFENLSIWQADDVTATGGAGIHVGFGAATVQSTKVILRNVYVEGTYIGYRLEAGVASTFDTVDASRCVSHGFDIRYTDGVETSATTSTAYTACYASLNGGDGFHIVHGLYLNWAATASDSNTGYGYYLEDCVGCSIHGGAESNTLGGFYLDTTTGCTLTPYVYQPNDGHGVTLDSATGTVFLGGALNSPGIGYAINRIGTLPHTTVVATTFANAWGTNRSNSMSRLLILSDANGIVGSSDRWSIGQDIDAGATLIVGGTAGATTHTILKVNGTHSEPEAARNVGLWAQITTANTVKTYVMGTGLYVPNATKGAASTITRAVGIYIAEQSVGTNNCNAFFPGASGSPPAGNWALYSGSTRTSVLLGPLRTTGMFRTATTKTANYTLAATDDVTIYNNTSLTATLPTAVGIADRVYVIKNVHSTTLTLATTSSQTINGAAPGTLAQWVSITVMSDGANWLTI